jgi:hypothetical protein
LFVEGTLEEKLWFRSQARLKYFQKLRIYEARG